MAKRRRKPKSLSDQLRKIIEHGPLTRYRISQDSGVDASQLLRFVHGRGKLTTDTLDRIGDVLKLRIVSELEEK